MKMSKILFFNSLIIGSLISVSAFSWFSMWVGLELNMLSFIPLMNLSMKKFSTEASLKYFLTQALSSMIILFVILVSLMKTEFLSNLSTPMNLILSSAFLTKLGMAPFHFWFPEIMEGISWTMGLVLLTWQKIAPMILILYNFTLNNFFFFVILSGMVISGLKNWNQLSLKKFFVFSSINHMSWMLSILFLNQSIWMFYFLLYSFMNFGLIIMFKKFKINSFSQLFLIFNSNKPLKLSFMVNLLSLGGLPPFLGFFPKWLVISSLMEKNLSFLLIFMIFLTLITLFVYVRTSMQSLILISTEMKKNPIKNSMFSMFFLNFFNLFGLVGFTLFFNF